MAWNIYIQYTRLYQFYDLIIKFFFFKFNIKQVLIQELCYFFK